MTPSPGLRAIVTGGASGIGSVIVDTFVAAGGTVAILDVDPGAVSAWAQRSHVTPFAIDVTDADAVRSVVPGLLSDWGGVDVLVNCAGIAGPIALAEDADAREWQRCLDVGLTSHFLMAQQVIPTMKAQRDGSIISIGSTSGLFGVGLRTAYGATKAGLLGLVRSLAVELGPYGVRANVVCPGSVRGPRIESIARAEAGQRGVSAAQVEAEYVSGQSVARLVEPQEVADLVAFLASPRARMISGQAIAVDGHTEAFHMPMGESGGPSETY